MKTAKDIAVIGMYTALLMGAQLVLSGVAGVEVVTVLLLCFCYVFGPYRGIVVATAFSLLRCFLFGFFINVVVLYLVYYNLFALFFGFMGKLTKKRTGIKNLIVATFSAVIFTACFTLLDDIISPIIYGFNRDAAEAYFYASLPVLVPQCICSLLTVGTLFIPLCRLFAKIDTSGY